MKSPELWACLWEKYVNKHLNEWREETAILCQLWRFTHHVLLTPQAVKTGWHRTESGVIKNLEQMLITDDHVRRGIWGGTSGKVSSCQSGRCFDQDGFDQGSRTSSGLRNDTTLQDSCLENPWAGEFGGLQSVGLQRVRHDWAHTTLIKTHHVGLEKILNLKNVKQHNEDHFL